MPAVLVAVLGFVISGLVWRILASIGFGLMTAAFVRDISNDYINRALNLMKGSMSADVAALLGIVGADDCLSVIMGGLSFVAVYKSLKLIFVRN